MNFLGRFSKKAETSGFITIRPVKAELFHAYRQTDTKLTVAFRNFANTPKNMRMRMYTVPASVTGITESSILL